MKRQSENTAAIPKHKSRTHFHMAIKVNVMVIEYSKTFVFLSWTNYIL